ncbi:hypothetical protein R3P38DRAFT_3299508 [Favolaschia claudopus]|uniref:Uncharacterized protein n=1 Tax=Favolaschia claudopus TaxID=2862362 RepID=A0AAV9Z072_9AGAR
MDVTNLYVTVSDRGPGALRAAQTKKSAQTAHSKAAEASAQTVEDFVDETGAETEFEGDDQVEKDEGVGGGSKRKPLTDIQLDARKRRREDADILCPAEPPVKGRLRTSLWRDANGLTKKARSKQSTLVGQQDGRCTYRQAANVNKQAAVGDEVEDEDEGGGYSTTKSDAERQKLELSRAEIEDEFRELNGKLKKYEKKHLSKNAIATAGSDAKMANRLILFNGVKAYAEERHKRALQQLKDVEKLRVCPAPQRKGCAISLSRKIPTGYPPPKSGRCD